MSFWSANLGLPYMSASQAQKHVTHNEALELLDALVQLSVVAFDATTPPAEALDGQVWAVGAGAVNAWAGHEGDLALRSNGGWVFIAPRPGWVAANGGVLRVFDGTTWAVPALGALPTLGVGTAADAVNVLTVAGPASLFTHAGAGHQMKLNKAGAADTASVLFQTGWSGRAEFGLTGNDNWTVKVSADGALWNDALVAEAATGRVSLPKGLTVAGTLTLPDASLNLGAATFTGTLPLAKGGTGATTAAAARTALGLGTAATAAVTTSATDTTAGRLVRVQDGYVKGSILGTVSQSAGVPTGAIIQRGTNANGAFVRFADGTQICTFQAFTTSASAEVTWTFPAAFAFPATPDRPAVAGAISGTTSTTAVLGIGDITTGTSVSVWATQVPSGALVSRSAALIAIGRWF